MPYNPVLPQLTGMATYNPVLPQVNTIPCSTVLPLLQNTGLGLQNMIQQNQLGATLPLINASAATLPQILAMRTASLI